MQDFVKQLMEAAKAAGIEECEAYVSSRDSFRAMITEGEVEHPVLGITCYAVTAGDQEGNEVDGIYVVSVSAGSDAAAQGLQPGDIITALNGQSVHQVSDVDLTGMSVGDSVTVTYTGELGSEASTPVAVAIEKAES